ncbi:MAG: metalloregulator ArsR/SmtB family transcription factor [Pirellulales bacterium]|nr:metalloregulator ArsR/SmtB family transcription factor [Pirellulales bacterium]
MKSELTVVDQASGEQTACASILKVLADETRLAVIEQLLNGPMNVGQINQSLGVEQTLLSHHLKVLRDAKLVTNERSGKQVIYSLTRSVQGQRRGRAINLGCCLISFD